MGQAKRRGNYQERLAEAIKRDADKPKPVYCAPPVYRSVTLELIRRLMDVPDIDYFRR
jgi:hypothetical protein